MNASAIAGVERIDARTATSPAFFRMAMATSPPSSLRPSGDRPPPPLSGIVELMGEVESRGAAAEVEDSHVRGMHGSDGGGVSWGRRRGSEEGRGMVHTHCGGDEHVRRRNIRLGVFCVC
jgi:hypothetical protein